MSQCKILHAADIHLDSPLRNLSQYENAPVDRIRGATRAALVNLVDLAIDQEVGLVVIAGDLYDGDWRDQNTGLFFVKQASRLIDAGIPLTVIRGNHDAFNKMTMNLRLPKNPDGSEVMLSEKKVDSREFDLDGASVTVHGRSYRKQHERGDLVKDFPKAHGGQFNLGLLHSSLTGFDGHTAYAPCTPEQLADFGYDYWALGHIHKRDEHQVHGAAPVVFSGNIQGRKINEPGAKGCVMVDVNSKSETTRTFCPLDVVRFDVCSIDASKYQSIDEVIDQFQNWLEHKVEEVGDRLLVPRVELKGKTRLHTELIRKLDPLEASLRSVAIETGSEQVWIEKIKLRTGLPDGSTEAGDSHADRDAMASVTKVVDELKESFTNVSPAHHSNGELFPMEDEPAEPEQNGPSAADWMGEELALLMSKLPAELHGEDSIVNLQDTEEVDSWLEQARAELVGRLQLDTRS